MERTSLAPKIFFLGGGIHIGVPRYPHRYTQLVTKNNDAILLFVTSDSIKIIENVTF